MKRISINIGFITNSSSVVHNFPRDLLEDPDVAAFVKAYGLERGLMPEDLWYRSQCTTVAMTKEQKTDLKDLFADNEYGSSYKIDCHENDDNIVVVYGDEYDSIASEFCDVLCDAMARKQGIEYYHSSGQDFN